MLINNLKINENDNDNKLNNNDDMANILYIILSIYFISIIHACIFHIIRALG